MRSGATAAMADGDPAVAIQWSIGAGLLSARGPQGIGVLFLAAGTGSPRREDAASPPSPPRPASGRLRRRPRRLVPPAHFLPVQVVTKHDPQTRAASKSSWAGRTVRVPPGFDRQTLADVLAVLEAPAMLSLPELVRIYVCLHADRHAEGFRFVGRLGAGWLGYDPLSGHLFVFRSRRGDRVKLLVVGPRRADAVLPAAGEGNLSLPDGQRSRRRGASRSRRRSCRWCCGASTRRA